MTSILRATAILSSSSLATILVGLVSAKAYALLVGPSGLGYMGLLQGLIGLSGLVAGLGVRTGLVRMGAEALGREDGARVAVLRRAAWYLFWLLGGVATLLLVLFRVPVSRLMLGGAEHAGVAALVAVALLFNMASEIQTGILNAHHRVAALAKIGIGNSMLGTSFAVGLVWRWGEAGIVAAVLLVPVVAWLVSRFFLQREAPFTAPRIPLGDVVAAGRSLLRFGAPYTLSMVAGAGVQFLIPVLVLNTLGQESVGYYRAAVTLSVTYLGFLLSAMALDYFPRVSAVSAQPKRLHALINQQHRLVMLLGVPMILGMLALAPYLIPIVYSSAFLPTVAIVEWQLIGDILKFSSWTMGFVILAHSGSLVFLLTEVVGGASYLAASWLGMHYFGLAGLGIGHLVSYLVYLALVWCILRKEIHFSLTPQNKLMLMSAFAAALAIKLLPLLALEPLRLPISLAIAGVAGAGGLYYISRELGGLDAPA